MFHSSSSSSASFVDLDLLPQSCCPAASHASDAATTRGHFDGNSPTHPPLLSPSPPYSSSAPSNYCLSRSSSSRSLPLHHHHGFVHFHPLPFFSSLQNHHRQQQPPLTLLTSSSPPPTSRNFIDSDAGPVRHVLSTGNIQGRSTTRTDAKLSGEWGGTAARRGRRGSKGTGASETRGISTRRSPTHAGRRLPTAGHESRVGSRGTAIGKRRRNQRPRRAAMWAMTVASRPRAAAEWAMTVTGRGKCRRSWRRTRRPSSSLTRTCGPSFR
ncbi:unnamed protein product [Musa acuminata var. zebrina]